jgi:thioredoxin 1
MSALKAVTDGSFETDVLRNPRPVIVEYWAEWCGPCRMLGPVLEQIAEELDGAVDVVKINSDDNPLTTQRYGILAVPTTSVFSGGEVVKQILGAKPKSALLRDLAEVL